MTAWTTRADVVAKLRRRWDSGEFLTAYASDASLFPLEVPLRGPGPRELATDLSAAQEWAAQWRKANGVRLEYQRVGGRLIGANDLPRRVWIDEWPQLWSLLGVAAAVDDYSGLLDRTRAAAPALTAWMLAKPHEVLALAGEWDRVVATVLWIDSSAAPGTFLRQVDVPGVDTKFIERHRAVLSRLLDRQLPAHRIETDCAPADFIGRYRFRRKPQYVRYRWLDPRHRTGGFTELTVRTDEFASTPPEAESILIVENETTYLALPPTPNTVAIFGGGYALTRLDALTWLTERRVRYWGDIDTHGFAILDRLRRTFPHTESVLMDRSTLLAHETQWVQENSPTIAILDHLRPAESELYRDLVEHTFGPSVRLEQERIRYASIESALCDE
ncbi:Wadjet anti-phage system protein JetD domain-containing protein [Nocardia sp. CA-151230]|uniref:Wadjet anti-phage system protein JetD domain-containing protein n=1 Tax=Nocardia sp. CA-151230 TaxID=3239982 RepID=UPI003D8FEB8B